MKKRLLLFLSCIFALTGCSSVSYQEVASTYIPPDVSAPETLKVGVLLPLSGVQEGTGMEMKLAIDMAFQGVRYKIGQYEVELVYIDSQGDGDIAAQRYEEAIRNKEFDLGFSGWNSNVSLACMEVAADYQVPHFFAFGAAGSIDDKYHSDPDRYKYWVGKGWPSADKLVIGYAEALAEAIQNGLWTPRNQNIVVFRNDWQWASSLTDTIMANFEAEGWQIPAVIEIGQDNDLARMDDYMDIIYTYDPAVVMGITSSADITVEFIKQVRQNGFEALFIADGYGQNSSWYEMAEGTSEYVLDQIPQFTGDRAESFIVKFDEAYGYEPSPSVGGMAYDWANYFIKVLQYTLAKYETITQETIMQCVEEFLIKGELTYRSGTVHYEYMFSEETFPEMAVGDGYYMFPVVQYIGDHTEIIWPSSSSTQSFQSSDQY